MWWVIVAVVLTLLAARIIWLMIQQSKQDEACKQCSKAPWFKKTMCNGCIKNTGYIEDLLER